MPDPTNDETPIRAVDVRSVHCVGKAFADLVTEDC